MNLSNVLEKDLSGGNTSEENMGLQNLLEVEVVGAINNFESQLNLKCNCNKCKLDIAALALNKLKPQYVVSQKGLLICRLEHLNNQYNSDLMKTIIKAAEIVGNSPRHD